MSKEQGKKSRRVRCILCNELVQQEVDIQMPYACRTVKRNKKRFCICSYCVDDLATEYLEWMEKLEGLEGEETSTESRTTKIVSEKEKKSQGNKASKERLNEKYPILEYSLDSLVDLIEKSVFGQREAIKKLAYIVYHNQMINLLEDMGFKNINTIGERQNAFIIGGTGCGKTSSIRELAKITNSPFYLANATGITAAGYIGGKVEDILEGLLDAAGGDIELAQNGIIAIDEIDKKAISRDGNGRDINGEAVQQELLKIMEPNIVPIKKGSIDFDTTNLTIYLCGAFVDLDEISNKRRKKCQIGFKVEEEVLDGTQSPIPSYVPEDIIQYGFLPELVGRVYQVIVFQKLDRDTIMDIIYKVLNQMLALFQSKGFDLIVDELLLVDMVDKIIQGETGAREVKARIGELLRPALYEIFQMQSGGVCEIKADGTIVILGKRMNDNTIYRELRIGEGAL